MWFKIFYLSAQTWKEAEKRSEPPHLNLYRQSFLSIHFLSRSNEGTSLKSMLAKQLLDAAELVPLREGSDPNRNIVKLSCKSRKMYEVFTVPVGPLVAIQKVSLSRNTWKLINPGPMLTRCHGSVQSRRYCYW